MSRRVVHPGEDTLALLAGGDLPLLERWRVSAHVRVCRACAATLNEYKRLREEFPAMGGEFDEAVWTRLEAEMRANIRLGLAAGAAVRQNRPAARRQWPAFRWAAVAASLAFVFGAGVWLERPLPLPQRDLALNFGQPLVETRQQGVVLRAIGSELELKGPEGTAALRTVGWDGSANARYFDGETGQVTIHKVAWEGGDAH